MNYRELIEAQIADIAKVRRDLHHLDNHLSDMAATLVEQLLIIEQGTIEIREKDDA